MGKMQGTSTADMQGASSQDVWNTQSPYLEKLYTAGQGTMQAGDPNLDRSTQAAADYARQMPGEVYDPLVASYQNAFGPYNNYNRTASALAAPLAYGLSDMVMPSSRGGSTPLLDKNVAMALEQASQNFRRNVLPSIHDEAMAAEQYGGSRGEIAEGLAMSDLNEQALRTAMQAYGDQYQTDINAQALQDRNRLEAAQTIEGIMRGQTENVGRGVQTGRQLTNLGLAPADIYAQAYNNRWLPIQYQQQLLGGPVVLGESDFSGTARTDPESSAFAPWSVNGGDNILADPIGSISNIF